MMYSLVGHLENKCPLAWIWGRITYNSDYVMIYYCSRPNFLFACGFSLS